MGNSHSIAYRNGWKSVQGCVVRAQHTSSNRTQVGQYMGSTRSCILQCREGLLTAGVRRRDDAELSMGWGCMLRWRMRAVRHEAMHCRLLSTPVTGHHNAVQYTVQQNCAPSFGTYQYEEELYEVLIEILSTHTSRI
jgi:hypothetical protein